MSFQPFSIPAYSVTKDDLPNLDNKTARGIEPLLENLNNSNGLMVGALNALTMPTRNAGSFTTAANGAQYVDITTNGQVSDLWPTFLQPTDGTVLDQVWSCSWIGQGAGVRVLFVGLVPLTTYNFGILYQ